MPCLEKITAHSLIARTNLNGKFGSDIARLSDLGCKYMNDHQMAAKS